MECSRFEKQHMSRLNRSQKEAVMTESRATLLLAVPGSGKTTVLITRLGYLILVKGVSPSSILTITYTVAAAKDMRNRFCALFGSACAPTPSFQTINSLALEIIHYYSRNYGRGPAFDTLGDETELNRILRNIYCKQKKEYPDDSVLREIRTAIAYVKNMEWTEKEIREYAAPVKDFPNLFLAYCDTLKAMGKMDFDDQLIYALRILKQIPPVIKHFQKKYPYICVDEAQDTSRIQHSILRELCGNTGRLFMVGDEDQSIYGFRGAFPQALLSFREVYPDAAILKLETNYRASEGLVAVANQFVRENRFRFPKDMHPYREGGNPVWPIYVRRRTDQYRYLCAAAKQAKERTAVLFRNHDSVLPLLDMLERDGIVYGYRSRELLFFNSLVVRDIRDLAAFALHPDDDEIFMRLYYKLSLYLTKSAALEACRISRREGSSIPDALNRISGLSHTTEAALVQLKSQLKQLLQDRAAIAVRRIRYSLHYGDYVEEHGLDSGKLDILELLAEKEADLFSLIQRLDNLSHWIQTREDHPEACFQLSTIHGAKGLEYETVYLLDVLDGQLPSILPEDDRKQSEIQLYEEERRIFYVALTRARKNLFLFYGFAESVFSAELFRNGMPYDGQWYEERSCYHSRAGNGKCLARGGDAVLMRKQNGDCELFPIREVFTTSSQKVCLLDSDANHADRRDKGAGYAPASKTYLPGTEIHHKSFGTGRVEANENGILTVCFQNGECKKLSLQVLMEKNCLLS